MTGISIFVHALRMVLGNLGPALRIGVLPLFIMAVAGWMFDSNFTPPTAGALPSVPGPGAFGSGIVLMVVSILVSLWVAVSWHRYILLEEQPGALMPGWNGAAIWAYFKVLFVIGILLFLLSIVISLVAGFVVLPLLASGGQVGFFAGLVLFAAVGLPLVWIGYRLGPSLAGAAIGDPRTLGESWEATSPGGIDLIVLSVVSVIALWLLQMLVMVTLLNVPPLAFVVSPIVTWLSVMVGVGIITTIFGHYIQGRPLNA